METKIYFGCSDPYGDNKPEDVFYKHILPILKKNNVKNKDIETITHKIVEMCEMSYSNGIASEAFDNTERDFD